MRRRNIKNNNSNNRKKNKTGKFLLIFATLFFISFLFLFTSFHFELRKVKIIGAKLVKEEEILKLSKVKPLDNYFRVNIKKMKEELLSNHLIKNVKINREGLNTIIIEVDEREPYMKIDDNGKEMIVDKERVILFRVPSDSGKAQKWSLPKLEGLKITHKIGEKIENDILKAAIECVNYSKYIRPRKISQIIVDKKDNLWFHTNDNLIVKLGEITDIEEKIYNLSNVLDAADEKNIRIKYVNLTVKDRIAIREFEEKKNERE